MKMLEIKKKKKKVPGQKTVLIKGEKEVCGYFLSHYTSQHLGKRDFKYVPPCQNVTNTLYTVCFSLSMIFCFGRH